MTVDWRRVPIKQVAKHVTVGFVGSQAPHFVEHGVPLLRGQNVRPYELDFDNLKYISPETHARWAKSSLDAGDVVIVRVGYPGTAAVVPEELGPLNAASLVIVRPDPTELDPYFLAYLLNSPWGKAAVAARFVGAAQQVLNTGAVADLEVDLPPLAHQRAVSGVLRALDDLIANNRRRVEVLEEVARAIYREWFVRFRFPGHDDVELVDSHLGLIPNGWELRTVGDVLELKYGKALKADARAGGAVAVIGSSGIVGWHDQELVSGPAIVLGRKGNVGSVIWIDGPCWPIDTTYFVETPLPPRFVAEQLRRTEFLNTHAAVPGLSREQAYSKPFLRPLDSVLDRFESTAGALASEGVTLTQQSERLTALRDLLMPKLVTGQLDVSTLDLDELVGDAVA